MNRRSSRSSQQCLRFLVATYRWLLQLYPASFRRAFGTHMVQVFRDSCHQAEREHGFPGLMTLWLATFLDLLRSALAEHLAEGTLLSRPFFIRASGLLVIVGATVDALLQVDGGASVVVTGYRGVLQYLPQVSHGEALLRGLVYTPVVCYTLGLAGLLLAQRGWVGRLCMSLAVLALGAMWRCISSMFSRYPA